MSKKTPTVAVLGARGMLGSETVPALRAAGFDVVALDLPEFDVADAARLAPVVAAADAVVNCAAYTNVDRAEAEPDLARRVNADAVAALGKLAARHDRYVLHIGTDFVFDGTLDRPYAETDTPQPLSVYGATKLAGDTALQATGCRHAIVRVQWTYGANGNHFIRKLAERAAQATELKMVADQVGAPTWTRDVARLLVAMVERRACGLFHYAASGYASRLEVAEFALRELGLERPLIPCRTADFPAPAQRPLNSRFDCRRVDALFPGFRRSWQDALREFFIPVKVQKETSSTTENTESTEN